METTVEAGRTPRELAHQLEEAVERADREELAALFPALDGLCRRAQDRLRRALSDLEGLRTRDPLLTVAQVAERLQVKPYTVAELVRRSEILSLRVGPRYVRIRQSALEAWMKGQETPLVPRGRRRDRRPRLPRLLEGGRPA